VAPTIPRSGIPADIPRLEKPILRTTSGVPAGIPRTILPPSGGSTGPLRTIQTIPTIPTRNSAGSGIPSNVPRTVLPSQTTSSTILPRKPSIETTVGPVRTIKPRPQGYVNPDLIPSASSPRRIDPTRSSLEELRNSLRNASGGAVKTP